MLLKKLASQKINISNKTSAIITIVFFIVIWIIFSLFPPQAVDWHYTFYPVSQNISEPYKIKSFINIPWTSLFLFPFRFIPENLSGVFNASLNVIIFGALIKNKGGSLLSLLLTYTSFPFLASIANGTIEWIPALGFLYPNAFGIILILTKPQSGLMVGVDWFNRQINKKLFIIMPVLCILISLIIWRNWPYDIWSNVNRPGMIVNNWSFFPWSIPIGLALIYYILKAKPKNSELLATLSTFCFIPYFAPHSLSISFTLISIYYPRGSIAIWLILWMYPIIHNLGFYSQLIGF